MMSTFVHLEALETILTFSKNTEELLRRKKVQRDVIFRYLANEGLAMPPNSEKHQLVKRTLEFWSSGKVRSVLLFHSIINKVPVEVKELCLNT